MEVKITKERGGGEYEYKNKYCVAPLEAGHESEVRFPKKTIVQAVQLNQLMLNFARLFVITLHVWETVNFDT